MTASIVARDAATGELGVAVFTAYPSVGMRVPFTEPGVGAVAVQSFAPRRLGPRALELLRAGAGAAAVIEALAAPEDASDTWQLAVLPARGEAAGFTGAGCVGFAGEATGLDCRCQANMMAAAGVPEAMCEAFSAAEGELAVRLLSALEAGERAGGDARGRMSAALVVAPSEGEPWERSADVRVDVHPDPLGQVARALAIHRAFALMDLAGERAAVGDGEGAAQAGMAALALAPDDAQLLLWIGLGAATGNLELGTGLVRRALELQPSLAPLLGRIPAAVMPAAPAVRERLAHDGQ
ncbi:MAG TPA: DUF1028 domain-containing protein [Solirubrobacteraceae bacterium]|nr:DUF1028 domain-containing protein [Solirubrobacteraceae bacterium]